MSEAPPRWFDVKDMDEKDAEIERLRGELESLRTALRDIVDALDVAENIHSSLGEKGVLRDYRLEAAWGKARVALSGVPEPPRSVTVHFVGGPWAGQTYETERVVGPVFAVGHEIGNHYWLDVKSDPPTYHWDGSGVPEPQEET